MFKLQLIQEISREKIYLVSLYAPKTVRELKNLKESYKIRKEIITNFKSKTCKTLLGITKERIITKVECVYECNLISVSFITLHITKIYWTFEYLKKTLCIIFSSVKD